MKLLTALLASTLILALGCYRKQKTPETKRHYWFVGYQAFKSKDYSQTGGFLQFGDSIISLNETKELIKQHINCSGRSYEISDIVILSFSEISDSATAYKLFGSDTAAWTYCEEPQEKPRLYKKLVVAGDVVFSDSDWGPIITPANRPLKITIDSAVYGNPSPSHLPDTSYPNIFFNEPSRISCFRPVMTGSDTLKPIRFEKRKDGGNIGRTMRNGARVEHGPPGYFEIMKWYWTGFPKEYYGWEVEFKEGQYLHGWTEGIKWDQVNLSCKSCGYLDRYTYDVTLTYGYDSKSTLEVRQNEDTADKYMKKKYPLPAPIPDTTIKPRYEYYYKLMIPVNKFSPPLDTINMVMDRMGRSMTVDQADELRAIVVRQLNNFIGRPTVDSVKIELPKK